jgi:two-component system NtrC family sensor kinase
MRKRPVHNASEATAVTVRRHAESAPVSGAEVSSSRPRGPEFIPQVWLDRLLLATVDLPVASGGERGVAEAMLGCVSSILGSYAVGACFTEPDGGDDRGIVLRRSPEGRLERSEGAPPARVFPGYKYEYVAPVSGLYSGATLHVASDEDELEVDGSPAVHLVDRAAIVLSHALPKARAASATGAGARGSASAIERRMMQADKLATFGQLAAGIVHELNNPLTSIVAYSDYLIRKVADGTGRHDPEDIERLRRISESANRMLRFTRELVGYARPSNGAVGSVAIHLVINQAIAFCEHLLSAAGVTIERRFATDAVDVQGVAEQLVQVFVNLLTNACQAAPATGGRIVVTTACHDAPSTRVVVTVEDNGCGIAPENLQHLFVPFFTTKRETHGTGLGLSIIKNIVASHDGTIRVESQVGQGTRFVIEMPPMDG